MSGNDRPMSGSGDGGGASQARFVHGFVRGLVQGVGFRAFTQRTGTALGLSGWVRNLWDGRVEFEASGPADRIDEFLARLRQGPRFAEVEAVEVTADQPAAASPPTGFQVRF